MMLRLADGDLEAQIEIRKKDLSTPSAFEKIARLCMEAHQFERAVTWAEKGLKLFPRRDARLVRLLRDLYNQLGRHDGLTQLAFADFAEKLDVASFAALKETCSPDEWLSWRDKAVLHVEEQLAQSLRARTRNRWPKFADGTLLVEMLLVDGELQRATAAVSKRGCSKNVADKLSVATADDPRLIGQNVGP